MVFVLPQELTIGGVAALRDDLLPRVRGPEPFELDARPLQEIDAAGLQLLCAAARAATRHGTSFRILGDEDGSALRVAMHTAGISSLDGMAKEVDDGKTNPRRG